MCSYEERLARLIDSRGYYLKYCEVVTINSFECIRAYVMLPCSGPIEMTIAIHLEEDPIKRMVDELDKHIRRTRNV